MGSPTNKRMCYALIKTHTLQILPAWQSPPYQWALVAQCLRLLIKGPGVHDLDLRNDTIGP